MENSVYRYLMNLSKVDRTIAIAFPIAFLSTTIGLLAGYLKIDILVLITFIVTALSVVIGVACVFISAATKSINISRRVAKIDPRLRFMLLAILVVGLILNAIVYKLLSRN